MDKEFELKINKGLDPYNCSIEELKTAIAMATDISDDMNNNQLCTKIFINSIYGATANRFYSLSNTDIAESITLQGQDLIKYSVRVIDDYFMNRWHLDYDTHRKIADEISKEIPDFNAVQFLTLCRNKIAINGTTLQVAGDTDSAYFSFEPLVKSLGISLDYEARFITVLYKVFIKDYLTHAFEEYAKKYNCDQNLEEFELEKIFRSGIFTAKKHYAGDISWKEGGPDGIYLNPLHKVIIKGLEAIQGSYPKFCRDAMKEFLNMMLTYTNKRSLPEYKDIVAWLVKKKMEFSMQSPENICKTFNLNDYEKYIYEDKTSLTLIEGASCPAHVRGAGVYNNLLYTKAKKWKGKYNFIKKGDKVKFYYAKDKYKSKNDPDPVFSYLPNNFPAEFAPPIDIDKMFEKLILDPLNRVIEACGYNAVPSTLTYSNALF